MLFHLNVEKQVMAFFNEATEEISLHKCIKSMPYELSNIEKASTKIWGKKS